MLDDLSNPLWSATQVTCKASLYRPRRHPQRHPDKSTAVQVYAPPSLCLVIGLNIAQVRVGDIGKYIFLHRA